MADQPQSAPLPPIDSRLAPFQQHHCSISDMRDATALIARDPAVQNILVGLGITRSDIDYNGDRNINPATNQPGNASNREWAATAIAMAQLTAITGKAPNQLDRQEIIDCGRIIYEKFSSRPGANPMNGPVTAPAVESTQSCDVESPIVRARRERASSPSNERN